MAEWSTEVHYGWDALADLSDWWNGQPAVEEIPFLHTRVLECWGRAFMKSGEEFQVRLLKRGADIVAAIPLIQRPGRLYSLSRDQVHLTDLVAIPDDEVLQQTPEWLNSLPVVHLHCFREESPLVRALDDYPRWVLRAKRVSPFLDLTGGIDAVRSNLSSNSRHALRRRWRRLHEAGEVTFVDHAGAAEIDDVLNAGLKLESAGWKSQDGRAVLKTPEYERFYRSLADVAQDEGWLRLSSLYLGDRLVAFHFDLVYEGRRQLLLTTYDESDDLASFSLGNLLLDAVVERSCEESLRSCEFGRGWGSWKKGWTSTAHPIYSFSIYGPGLRSGLLSARHRRRVSND